MEIVEKTDQAVWRRHIADLGPPEWWNHHGLKLKPEAVTNETGGPILVLKSNTARLTIASDLYKEVGWRLSWRIKHSAGGVDRDEGYRTFQDRQLKIAFGLDDRVEEDYFWLMSKFKATAAHQGLYIRRREWLNLPGPGNGLDGDPNLSVLADDEVKSAVRELLSSPRNSVMEDQSLDSVFQNKLVAQYQV